MIAAVQPRESSTNGWALKPLQGPPATLQSLHTDTWPRGNLSANRSSLPARGPNGWQTVFDLDVRFSTTTFSLRFLNIQLWHLAPGILCD